MKKIILLVIFLFLLNIVFANQDCFAGNYIEPHIYSVSGKDQCGLFGLNKYSLTKTTLNGQLGFWGCDDTSTQTYYCLNISCQNEGNTCGVGECRGTFTCSENGLTCSNQKSPSTEICDGKDNDCDGQIDEGVKLTFYKDNDGDGYGTINSTIQACSVSDIDGYVSNSDDTDDSNPNINPGEIEICDGIDNDGDGSIDDGIGMVCIKGTTGCTDQCTFQSRKTATCSGTIPNHSTLNNINGSDKFTQNYNGTTWLPSTKNYSYSTQAAECAFKCNQGYLYDSGSGECRADLQQANCSGSLPSNSVWNDFGQFGKYTYTTANNPNLSTSYSETEGNCNYKCASGYYREGSQCVSVIRTNQCTSGSLPANTEWTTNEGGTYLQEYNGTTWLPVKEFKFEQAPATCNYYCTSNKKSCDNDVSNGCETNILTDNQNCGVCGNICNGTCTNGICIGETTQNNNQPTIDTNTPTDNNIPKPEDKNEPVIEYECLINSDCSGEEICMNNFCQIKNTNNNSCLSNNDCLDSEICSGGTCKEVICGDNFEIKDHYCSCEANLCGDSCYKEKGVCCNNNWNEGVNSCNINYSDFEELIISSDDQSAINYLRNSKTSSEAGEITKARAELEVSKLKALIVLNNKSEFNEDLISAELALSNNEYENAILIAENASSKIDINKNTGIDFTLIIIVLVVLLVIGYFAYARFLKKEYYEEEYP